MMSNEWWIGKDEEGIGSILTYYPNIWTDDHDEPQDRMAGLRTLNFIRFLPN
jgi:hypothetical protein